MTSLCDPSKEAVGETFHADGALAASHTFFEDPSTVLRTASSRVIVYNGDEQKFLLHTYNVCIDAEFKVAVVERVKSLLEYKEEHGGSGELDPDGLESAFQELDYPFVDDDELVPVQRVLYKAFGRTYWREVLKKLWLRNSPLLGEASEDYEVLLLVFRLTSRARVQFDLVEVYNEGSVVLTEITITSNRQDSTEKSTTEFVAGHANSILSALGNGSAILWDAVSKGDETSLKHLGMMTHQVSQGSEDPSAAEAHTQYPYWPGDASLVYIAPDGADFGDALNFRMNWYLHGSKEFIRLQSVGNADKEPRPLVRILSLQSYLAKEQVPCALTSVNAFGMFRQIVNWFLLCEEKREQLIDLYGDKNAGLYHVPAVLHRPPDWQPLNGAHGGGLSILPRVIRSLFLERLPGIPADDDERLAQFEGDNLMSCSMSIANNEIGESCLHYYGGTGVSWQSQRIATMSDEELMQECCSTASATLYDDGYGDKSALFDGYSEDLHQTLAELYVNFRASLRGEFRSFLQLIALVGEDIDGPQSLQNSVYISGRFGNYDLSEMCGDKGASLWEQVKGAAIERIRHDAEQFAEHPGNDNTLLDSEIQNLIKGALEFDAGTGLLSSVTLSNAELRTSLLNLQKACWPSYALGASESERCVNAQVRIVPNSAEHRPPIRTFRLFTEEDKQQLNDFVEANLSKLESLSSFSETS